MKKTGILCLAAFALPVYFSLCSAQTLAGGQIDLENVQIWKDHKDVNVTLDLNLDKLQLRSNRGIVLSPMYVGGSDTLRLGTVEVLGRKRYIYYQRTGKTASEEPSKVIRRLRKKAQSEHLAYTFPYEQWMNGGSFVIERGDCGCDQASVGSEFTDEVCDNIALVGEPKEYVLAYQRPEAEAVKNREESGSARLNFLVGKSDIRPEYGNNAAELQKIRETIDLVREDADVTLTGVQLHGYASPDGRYASNAILAQNRTEALETYLLNYYKVLDTNLFTASSTAEDWDGVREYMEDSDYAYADKILEIIDGDLTLDEKDRAIAKAYPDFYKNTLLNEVYPSLRRTDYRVTYSVRNFDLEDARRVIKERPGKLSLNEMFLVANSYETGSEEFGQVFDIAVRLYPDSPVAALNAACVALERGDLVGAEKLLEKAGDSPEARNARGVLAARRGEFDKAQALFTSALPLSAANANREALAHNREIIENQ
jgi:outer membrane protein OmpA-like peptidoglycan-associated protein